MNCGWPSPSIRNNRKEHLELDLTSLTASALATSFVHGLRPELHDTLQRNNINWQNANMSELQTLAQHYEDVISRKLENTQHKLMAFQLKELEGHENFNLWQAPKSRSPMDQDPCWNCKKKRHGSGSGQTSRGGGSLPLKIEVDLSMPLHRIPQ